MVFQGSLQSQGQPSWMDVDSLAVMGFSFAKISTAIGGGSLSHWPPVDSVTPLRLVGELERLPQAAEGIPSPAGGLTSGSVR